MSDICSRFAAVQHWESLGSPPAVPADSRLDFVGVVLVHIIAATAPVVIVWMP